MKAHIGRRLSGPAGSAAEVIIEEHDVKDHEATVATWFLDCPGQSTFWRHFVLNIVHLRDIEGVRPATITVPGATHEIALLALEPAIDGRPEPAEDDYRTWRYLRPTNYADQLQLPSDEAAKELLEVCVRGILVGVLWAEPPLSGQVEPWRTSLLKSAAHLRGEEHAP